MNFLKSRKISGANSLSQAEEDLLEISEMREKELKKKRKRSFFSRVHRLLSTAWNKLTRRRKSTSKKKVGEQATGNNGQETSMPQCGNTPRIDESDASDMDTDQSVCDSPIDDNVEDLGPEAKRRPWAIYHKNDKGQLMAIETKVVLNGEVFEGVTITEPINVPEKNDSKTPTGETSLVAIKPKTVDIYGDYEAEDFPQKIEEKRPPTVAEHMLVCGYEQMTPNTEDYIIQVKNNYAMYLGHVTPNLCNNEPLHVQLGRSKIGQHNGRKELEKKYQKMKQISTYKPRSGLPPSTKTPKRASGDRSSNMEKLHVTGPGNRSPVSRNAVTVCNTVQDTMPSVETPYCFGLETPEIEVLRQNTLNGTNSDPIPQPKTPKRVPREGPTFIAIEMEQSHIKADKRSNNSDTLKPKRKQKVIPTYRPRKGITSVPKRRGCDTNLYNLPATSHRIVVPHIDVAKDDSQKKLPREGPTFIPIERMPHSKNAEKEPGKKGTAVGRSRRKLKEIPSYRPRKGLVSVPKERKPQVEHGTLNDKFPSRTPTRHLDEGCTSNIGVLKEGVPKKPPRDAPTFIPIERVPKARRYREKNEAGQRDKEIKTKKYLGCTHRQRMTDCSVDFAKGHKMYGSVTNLWVTGHTKPPTPLIRFYRHNSTPDLQDKEIRKYSMLGLQIPTSLPVVRQDFRPLLLPTGMVEDRVSRRRSKTKYFFRKWFSPDIIVPKNQVIQSPVKEMRKSNVFSMWKEKRKKSASETSVWKRLKSFF